MADPNRKSVPLYQTARHRVAGVEASLKAGDSADAASATWLIRASSLAGIIPRSGDRCRGTDGVWWLVESVGTLVDGAYPCQCTREE